MKSGDLILRVYPPNYSITTTSGATNANITLNEMSLLVRYLETDQKEYNSVLNFSMNPIRLNNLTYQTEEFTFNGQTATSTPLLYKILTNKERWGPGILFVTIYNGQQGSNSATLYDFVAPAGISQLYVQTDNNKKYTTNQDVFFTPTELLAKATYLFKSPFFNYNNVYPICFVFFLGMHK